MTLTIELPPDLQQQLEQAAAEAGQAPAEYAQAALVEKLAVPPAGNGSIEPAEEGEDPAITALRARYAAAGIRWNGKKFQDREPVARTVDGSSVSELLIQERR